MAAKKQPSDAKPQAGALHPLQRFTMQRMRRVELVACPYNPRIITEKQRKALTGILRRLGLLEPLTWNKRSATLISGHQRLRILDALAAGQPDFSLDISVVDLSPKQEREAIVALNNTAAMAEFEVQKLEAIFADRDPEHQVDPEATGFTVADLYTLFGTDPLKSDQLERLQDLSDQARQLQEAYDAVTARGSTQDGFYRVVVFRDSDEAERFDDALGFDEHNRYVDGRVFARLIVAHQKAQQEQKALAEQAESEAQDGGEQEQAAEA